MAPDIVEVWQAQLRTVLQARFLEVWEFQKGAMTLKLCWRLSARLERTLLLPYQP